MANTAGISNSFKSEILSGIHALGTTVVRGSTTADSIKAALYLASATIGPTTTAYTATGEVSGTNYTAGGAGPITNATAPSTISGVGCWTPSASISWATVTLATSFDTVMLYNSTQGNKSISIHTFGAQTITAGTFTLTMPTNDQTNALVRIS